ncbi:phage tail protein [Nonomuraea sp. NPDC052116]|uniref:phage tail protein n=1 Tax=Nonomuraea TaxID=83681 RepID=UPI0033C43FD3
MPFRERPYSQFNFQVDFGTQTDPARAGFQEINGIAMEIAVAEYRNGNEVENTVRKITGLYKVPDVTLKRGVIGDNALYLWLEQVRTGQQDALRQVTIRLLAEDRTPAQSWRLLNARPTKYTGPPLIGTGTALAIEELVLASEGIQQGFD